MPASERPGLSVLVMTYNEEKNIVRCLSSVQGLGDEIVVLDSFSTDQTVSLAVQAGARLVQHSFDTFADQRRRLVNLAKNDWILMLDADEYLSDALRQSIIENFPSKEFDAFSCNRRNRVGTRWIRHGSWYPDKKIRLFNRRSISITGHDVHETVVPHHTARVGHLKGDLLHLADEDIGARYEKVNLYSTRAALELLNRKRNTNFFKIHFKPFFRFVSVYIFRLGFLDGFYGYVIARSEAHYVWLREVKLREMKKLESESG